MSDSTEDTDSYPRQSARTQRYTLGEPRDIVVSPDGRRIVFLRSRGPTDPVNCLWVVDADTGDERLVADPEVLLRGRDDGTLPPEERARRERAREAAAGITAFATDAGVSVASFAIAGRLFLAGLISAQARELPVAGPIFDPRPDPVARHVAYVSGRLLCIGELDGRWNVLAGGEPDEPESITWGSADFIAAEEMNRFRGYWWNPDGTALAVARVDTSPVQRWHIGDPAQPETPPTELAYPAAGTPNADVTLHLVDLDGNIVDVEWDRGQFPYLVDVHWTDNGLIITTQRRDQRMVEVLEVSPATGATELRWADMDDQWVELVPGVPRLGPDGTLITCADRDGARRLLVDGEPVTPPDLQVRTVESADGPGIVFLANPIDDATVLHVWRRTVGGELEALTDEPGVHAAAAGGGTVVIRTATLTEPGAQWETLDGVELTSYAATPVVHADVHLSFLGERRIATAVLLPADHDGSPLPVLVDPYGGPHAGRVVRAHNAHVGSQWFADQGFAVVVADGRGTPGRGWAWERAVHLDLATPVLEDQVEALERAAEEYSVLDLGRVAIRGWSFGGYLAALAVLRRPDVFHAAVAGAPVTEWRLYDTHYTERYLGDPAEQPDAYDASSLLPLAAAATRPLLLIHGLADDNVVAAHTLRLSSALLAAGRSHEVLPLAGITHMTPQEIVAENLLLHQLDFLRRALLVADGGDG
jgi:dipeptidyl-peptidase 4